MDDFSEFHELKVEEVEGEDCQETDSCLPTKRERILQEARVNRNFLEEHPEYKNDREIVLEAVKVNGWSLQYANEELRNDRGFILEAVKENGYSLEYASEKLRNDREIVLEAVKVNGCSLVYASEELRNDREFVLGAVRKNGWSLQYASEELRNDREIVLETVKVNGRSLEYASEELRNDRELILESVGQYVLYLKDVSEELRNDAGFLLKVLLKVRGMECFRFMGESVLKKHSILRLGKKFEGDLEKVYEEYTSGNVEKDEFFEEIFQVKLRNGPYCRLDGFIYGYPFLLKFSEEKNDEEEESRIEQLQKKLSNVGFNDLEILRFLGRGAYGGTYLCTIYGVEGLFVAKFNNRQLNDNKMKELVERDSLQRDGLYLPYHKNVVSILSHKDKELVDLTKFPDYEEYWKSITTHISPKKIVVGMILMKYHRISLSDLVGKSTFVFESNMFDSFHRIFEGVHHLYKNFIVHRDLHPGNIFVYPSEGRVWIGDFGCALDLRGNENQKSKFLVHKDHEIMFCVTGSSAYFKKYGTEEYTAPEILNFDRIKETYLNYEKSDLYSFGVLLKWVAERTFPEMYESGVEYLASAGVIEGLLADDPQIRIGFDEAFGQMKLLIDIFNLYQKNPKTKTNVDEFDFEVTGVTVGEMDEKNDDSEKRNDYDEKERRDDNNDPIMTGEGEKNPKSRRQWSKE